MEGNQKALQRKIQIDVEINTKKMQREIQMDVDLLISRRTVGDGSLPLPPTKQTERKMILGRVQIKRKKETWSFTIREKAVEWMTKVAAVCNFTPSVQFYTQYVILHTVCNFTVCNFTHGV